MRPVEETGGTWTAAGVREGSGCDPRQLSSFLCWRRTLSKLQEPSVSFFPGISLLPCIPLSVFVILFCYCEGDYFLRCMFCFFHFFIAIVLIFSVTLE